MSSIQQSRGALDGLATAFRGYRIADHDAPIQPVVPPTLFVNPDRNSTSMSDSRVRFDSSAYRRIIESSENRRRSEQRRQCARVEQRERRAQLTKSFFSGSVQVDNHSDWLGVKSLGAGGQGAAGLWIRVDDKSRTIDRVVIKEAQPSKDTFDNPNTWKDGVLYGVSKEAHMNFLATTNSNEDPVLTSNNTTIRGQSVQRDRCTYRIYLGYCPYGDLWEMVRAQLQLGDRPAFVPGANPVQRGPGSIPQGAILSLFIGLANATINMRRPPQLPSDAPEGSGVVHNDIKPDNIFLTDPKSTSFPKYPDVRIGDFGSAVLTHDKDPGNPLAHMRQPITDGYIPLELFGYQPDAPRLLGSWTNVYQIGMTIYACMVGTGTPPYQIDFGRHARSREDYFPDFSLLAGRYSKELIAIVRDCVEPLSEDRPTPVALKYRLDDLKEILADNMHDPNLALALDRRPYHLRMDLSDKYRVGMIYVAPSATPSILPPEDPFRPNSAARPANFRGNGNGQSPPAPAGRHFSID